MVTVAKVWYEPPPFGPGTSLNRPRYGIGPQRTALVQNLSRRPQGMVIAGACVAFAAIAYIPIMIRESRQGLPFTFSPEYQAATRAYMRYHNMNPIYGISSKTARAADEAH
mmetsp:Transcript_23666/g.50652  ORF Transcript_23666/g.50652 Transcript_23666/m.50652 type:complete len:111 (-) Transcript_23666:163-495(-)|eukprot:CAMPEP_0172525614 /NCGR_PEP_ID=MMETSP1067-20121228/669_1 /TAXON_ID=265564 ORGANISM="Thalassiosira punctigera, Strain Tpunct2005C2" /NCGR_SAMPLE_ID=MMETSP1067 /ASSEMBLY_ACC=CAM_ASM_000444 /LENGTH=110 /DNA_ID=CAMNT_0013308925 /DNA_START=79 /DNA_END=411 /DNA_ORIENTATION=+